MGTKLASGKGQYKGDSWYGSFVPTVFGMDFGWFWNQPGHPSTVLALFVVETVMQ